MSDSSNTSYKGVLTRFENEVKDGGSPEIADVILTVAPEQRSAAIKELISIEVFYRMNSSKPVSADDYSKFGEDAVAHAIMEIVKYKSSSAFHTDRRDISEDITAMDQGEFRRETNQTRIDLPRRSNTAEQTTGYFGRQESGTVKESDENPTITTPAPNKDTDDDFRFKVRGLHAAGGLGEVYIATDKELDRKVALKRIKDEWVHDEVARQRFDLESYVTGNLEHPGVVPVYSAGESKDGNPYYAMRFVRGKNMKDEIEKLHKTESGKALYQGIDFRNLLDHFVDACHTIAYSHSKGVLHRDIKPSNIMLGKYGETLIVDWGLAKKLDQPDIFPSSLVDDASMMSDMSERSGSSATMQGSTIGTPAFMSPEQAEGRLDRMDSRSDIYSLGSTLYMLLTGDAPYKGNNGLEIVDRVRQGDFQLPRNLKQHVPRQLQSICMKSMAFEPSDRYKTASHFAADIQNFLADQSVAVHSESMFERFGRWMRKNRSTALALAAGLITITALTLGSLIWINKERAQKTEALNSKLAATIEAEKSLRAELDAKQQTREVLNKYSVEMTRLLPDSSNLSDQQRDLLVSLVLDMQNSLSVPDILPLDEARSLLTLSGLQHSLGRSTESIECIGNAIDTISEVQSKEPRHLNLMNGALILQGKIYMDEMRIPEAIEAYKRADRNYEALIDMGSDVLLNRYERATTIAKKGKAFFKLGDKVDASINFQNANEIFNNLLNANPEYELVVKSIQSRFNIAWYWSLEKDTWPFAIRTYKSCTKELEKLIKKNSDPELINLLAQSKNNLANTLISDDKFEEALPYCESAIAPQQELIASYPKHPRQIEFQKELATSFLGLGICQTVLHEPGAGENLTKAETNFKELASKDSNFKTQYASALVALARYHDGKNRVKSSEYYLLADKVLGIKPASLQKLNQVLLNRIVIANWMRQQAKYVEALKIYEKNILQIDENQDKNLASEIVWKSLFGYADCLTNLRRWEQAERVWRRLTLNKEQPHWITFEIQRAICLTQLGNLWEGTTIADSVLDMDQIRPVSIYDVACCYGVAAEYLVDKKQATDSKGRDANWYRKEAINRLERAAEEGFFGKDRMRKHAATDSDLDSLREMPEFIEFAKKYGIAE